MNPADWKLRRLDLTLCFLFLPVLISGSVKVDAGHCLARLTLDICREISPKSLTMAELSPGEVERDRSRLQGQIFEKHLQVGGPQRWG